MSDEYVCPICLNVMIEPVTLPCDHGLCKSCLETTLSEAAMQCPMCRYRLSTWARRNRKKGTLVNEEKWKEIKTLFQHYVSEKLSGNASVELTEDEESIIRGSREEDLPRRALAAPGDLRAEYEGAVAREAAATASDEAASLQLVRQLEARERELWSARQALCEQDAAMARQLQATESPGAGAGGLTSTPTGERPRRASWLDRFMAEKQRLRPGSADSIGPELGLFRPIETFPLSPSKAGSADTSASGRDCPLRPTALPSEASKENAGPVPGRPKTRTAAGAVAKPRTKAQRRRTLNTSEGTAFRPVGNQGKARNRSILEFAVRTDGKKETREEADLRLARELQRRFDIEHRLGLTAMRFAGDKDAYMLRDRAPPQDPL